jgi:polar amino acid transport system substrate-binding protein
VQFSRARGTGARAVGFAGGCLLLARLAGAAEREVGAADLVASLPELPGQIESTEAGPVVELLRAIDDVYREGEIHIGLFPFVRSVRNVELGEADFHLPLLRELGRPPEDGAYRYASEDLGEVQFVLYSHVSDPLTVERIEAARRAGGEFPYVIERMRGVSRLGDFPLRQVSDLEQALRRVAARRSHGFVMAQEETDRLLRELRLKDVHRAPYAAFGDAIVIAPGPRGDAVDAVLSEAIRSLKRSGRWQQLYQAVHRPYDDWQPAQLDW